MCFKVNLTGLFFLLLTFIFSSQTASAKAIVCIGSDCVKINQISLDGGETWTDACCYNVTLPSGASCVDDCFDGLKAINVIASTAAGLIDSSESELVNTSELSSFEGLEWSFTNSQDEIKNYRIEFIDSAIYLNDDLLLYFSEGVDAAIVQLPGFSHRIILESGMSSSDNDESSSDDHEGNNIIEHNNDGIENIHTNTNEYFLNVWPNPLHSSTRLQVSSNFHISSGYIFDINGKIYDKIVQNGKTFSLDFSKYLPGVYYLYFKSHSGKTFLRKVVIQ